MDLMSLLVRLFTPFAAQLFSTAGKLVIRDRTHRVPPGLGPRLETEDLTLQIVEITLDARQTLFHAVCFHRRKLVPARRFAKDGQAPRRGVDFNRSEYAYWKQARKDALV